MRLRYVVVLAVAALAFASPALADTGFSASLDGLQEVGPNASPGTGSATLVLDNAQANLSYVVTYSGLTAARTAAHIHGPAAPGVNAGVLHGLLNQTGTTSGSANGVWAIPAAQLPNLFNGLMYLNIHTGNFPGGEIRGQINGAPTASRATTWGRLKKLYQ